MKDCIFVSDLHGSVSRCQKLFDLIQREKPNALFIGGDLLPSSFHSKIEASGSDQEFIADFLIERFLKLRDVLADRYPEIFIILGNDDPANYEQQILLGVEKGVWKYVHNSRAEFGDHFVYGYSFVPPTPFQLKDWEKYDVSRHVDPGCVSPEEGFRSQKIKDGNPRYQTISNDLQKLTGDNDLSRAIFLFHSPPYQTNLDRADLDGEMIDHVPLDVNVGSIAIKKLIENKQPMLTLHGHIHESARLTGSWRDKIGHTHLFGAAHDSPELAVVRFDLNDLNQASRLLL